MVSEMVLVLVKFFKLKGIAFPNIGETAEALLLNWPLLFFV
jgi:hypothetical protein